MQSASTYLASTSQRQAEAAYIATYNEDTGDVTERTGNEAGIRTDEDVQFTDGNGQPLTALPDGRILEGEEGDRRETNEIVLVTGHGHPRTENRGLDRANESIARNPGDQTLSRVAPLVLRTPTGTIRVFVGGQEREVEE